MGVGVGLEFAASSPAFADRAFDVRFSTNTMGDIVMAANTLLSCQEGAAGCADARAGSTGAKLGNNAWDMRFVDIDADATTFNSSRAAVAVPADATVLFAGLYWGANTRRGTGGFGARAADLKHRVRFAAPTSGYVTVTANRVDDGTATSQVGAYHASRT